MATIHCLASSNNVPLYSTLDFPSRYRSGLTSGARAAYDTLLFPDRPIQEISVLFAKALTTPPPL